MSLHIMQRILIKLNYQTDTKTSKSLITLQPVPWGFRASRKTGLARNTHILWMNIQDPKTLNAFCSCTKIFKKHHDFLCFLQIYTEMPTNSTEYKDIPSYNAMYLKLALCISLKSQSSTRIKSLQTQVIVFNLQLFTGRWLNLRRFR